MIRTTRRRRITRSLAAFVSLAAGFGAMLADGQPRVAFAATDAAVSLTPAQASSFEEALKALAAQGKVGFVAEGFPLHPVLSKEETPNLKAGLPLDEAVKRLAQAFDYDVTRRGNLFSLKKRYSDLYDLPIVTLEEYALALGDIVKLLSSHAPQPPITTNTDFVVAFAKSVTPEQEQAMREGTLPIRALSPTQQAQMRRMALHIYVALPLKDAQETLFLLRQSPRNVLRKKYAAGQVAFGYDFADHFGRTVFRPLNGSLNAQVAFPGADPLPRDKVPEVNSKGVSEKTLGSVAADLNARGNGGKDFVVDAALAAKPVQVIGTQGTGSALVFDALATVYGLRVVTQEDGTKRLTRPAFRPVSDVADLSEAVRRLLPEPLLRALHVGAEGKLRQQQIALRQISHDPRTSQEERVKADTEYNRLSSEAQGFGERPDALVQRAARRLRTSVEPKLTREGASVAVSTLSTLERSAFGLTLLQEFFPAIMQQFGQGPPPYIAHWDEANFKGGLYQEGGRQKFEVGLSVIQKNPDGSTDETGIGIGSINYPGP